jgi:hypothetical protein
MTKGMREFPSPVTATFTPTLCDGQPAGITDT